MKITLIIIFLSILSPLAAQSYIRVSNNPGAIADYSNLQTAINNAPIGSTIFVEPSTTNYGSISISKRINLLGGGYDATKHNNKVSQINNLYLSNQYGNSNRSIISGFLIYYVGCNTIDSVTIQRCNITNNISLTGTTSDSVVGWKIINCKTSNIGGTYSKNIVISNNILYNGYLASFDQYSVFISNNIIGFNSNYAISRASFSNNIFINTPSSCSTCSFSNNITAGPTLNYGDNVCTNNLEGIPTTSVFVNYGADWHLKSTCPGVNAGSDGKDIGIYGGLFPFPDADYGITGYPEINSLNITNPLVEPNGTLKVNVKSKIIH